MQVLTSTHHRAGEKEVALQKAKKAEKKAEKQPDKHAAKLGVAPAVKTKRKGIRVKKGVRVKGIKVTDAASKRKVRRLLAAQQALREMQVEPAAGPADAGAAMV